MAAILPSPPRLSSASGAENVAAILNWAFQLYQILEAEQQVLSRLNAIAAVDTLTQSISNPPTQAQVTALQTKVNELIAAAQISSS